MDLPPPAHDHPPLDSSPSPAPPNLFSNPGSPSHPAPLPPPERSNASIASDDEIVSLDDGSDISDILDQKHGYRAFFQSAAPQFPYPQITPFERSAPTIQRIHNCFWGIERTKALSSLATPMVVAIGPYHHNSPRLQEMEVAKEAAVEEFCKVVNQSRQEVGESIYVEAIYARECYQGLNYSSSYPNCSQRPAVSGPRFTLGRCAGCMVEDSFVDMMLVDGCFLLQFIVSMCTDCSDDPLMSREEVRNRTDAIARDIMLLENQIPWSVLDALMKIRPGVPIDRFLDLMASAFDVGNERANNLNDLQGVAAGKEKLISDPQVEGVQQQAGGNTNREQEDGLRAPDHLLALFHRRQVGAAHTNKLFVPRLSSLSSTAVELAEMGVKLIASKTKKFGDMSLKKRQWRGSGLGLFGSLSLAPVVLNDLTGCWIVNMAAYEAILGAMEADNFAISSYMFIMSLLMNREEDVHELRSKGIVHSTFSNEGTLRFFKYAGPHLRVGHRYYEIFKSLDEYRQKRWVWIAVHRYFYKNIKTIATILSIAGVLAGLFKTILSLRQPGQVPP